MSWVGVPMHLQVLKCRAGISCSVKISISNCYKKLMTRVTQTTSVGNMINEKRKRNLVCIWQLLQQVCATRIVE